MLLLLFLHFPRPAQPFSRCATQCQGGWTTRHQRPLFSTTTSPTNSSVVRSDEIPNWIPSTLITKSLSNQQQRDWSFLSSSQICLPQEIVVPSKKAIGNVFVQKETPSTVIIRLISYPDLDQVRHLCMKEYGPKMIQPWTVADAAASSPWLAWMQHCQVWWEAFSLLLLIEGSMRLKLLQYHDELPRDYVILVLSTADDQIMGMVELSRQPASATRNPPAVPLPIWWKQALLLGHDHRPFQDDETTTLQAWVSNLLIHPSFRRQGHGQLLMAAVEGVVRRWNKEQTSMDPISSIHLHADADPVAGWAAQSLYRQLGYRPPASLPSGLVLIDGMALVYLRKQLEPLWAPANDE
jgi:GNAT superfamily N-acetyltransferase